MLFWWCGGGRHLYSAYPGGLVRNKLERQIRLPVFNAGHLAASVTAIASSSDDAELGVARSQRDELLALGPLYKPLGGG